MSYVLYTIIYMFIFYTFLFYVVHSKFECESCKKIIIVKQIEHFLFFHLNKECEMLINLHQQECIRM
jgi:hypothetical protein